MKKFFLIIFILLDLAAMSAAAFILYMTFAGHMHGLKGNITKVNAARVPTLFVKPQTPANPATVSVAASTMTPTAPPPASPYRNIGFTYKNAKAKQVLIRADFTGWKGIPMKREPNGLWSYAAQLLPGDYAYCFTVDDKIIKDPASKHTKKIAQTVVSAITVEKAPVKVTP